ncbi:MAG: OmpA family protein, partial [bacterium]
VKTADSPVEVLSHVEARFNTKEPGAELKEMLQSLYYDYDKHNLRTDALARLEKIAPFLAGKPDLRILIEGYADERGTDEYNMGLGENRARSAHQYLVNYGIDSKRFAMVTYGKTRPGLIPTARMKNVTAETDALSGR